MWMSPLAIPIALQAKIDAGWPKYSSSQDTLHTLRFRRTLFMKYVIACSWASFSRTFVTAAMGAWLAFAMCPAASAANGAQAAAAAKEAAKAFGDYAAGVARSGESPDYVRPPVAEHFRRIFDADTLASLSSPQPEDIGWVTNWAESAESSFKILAMFGVQKDIDIDAAIARNMVTYENEIATALAFMMHLNARVVSTATIFVTPAREQQLTEEFRKTLLERAELGLVASHRLVDTVLSATQTMSNRLKPQNAALMMSAVRETLPAWAPYASANKRDRILKQLEQVRAANAGAGIDEDVAAVLAIVRKPGN
jgi:hypothetical protein